MHRLWHAEDRPVDSWQPDEKICTPLGSPLENANRLHWALHTGAHVQAA